NLAIDEDAGPQTIPLTGISSGAPNELQNLTISAVSGNPGLIPNPTVNYASPAGSGTLTFTSLPNANGTAVITVTVNDGQPSNNLLTRTFTVTVNAVNDPPTISDVADQVILENTPTGPIPFTVGDAE